MNKITPLGRLIIVLLIIGAGFGIYTLLKNQGIIGKTEPKTETTDTDTEEETENNTEKTDSKTDDKANENTKSGSFSYSPTEPVNGKHKGVVELGASGFNSFIITIDDQKNWKLDKAEFGTSLVKDGLATEDDIRIGLKAYISKMIDFGVAGKDIHFVVSSGATKEAITVKITKVLKTMGYNVNTVTPEQEGTYGMKATLPKEYENKAFFVDIGSGNTKISWKENGQQKALEAPGAKYYQKDIADKVVYDQVAGKAKQIPADNNKTCFIIGGSPFKFAKEVRKGKERYTVLKAPDSYDLTDKKDKAGLNIYKSIAEATGCETFVFDWDTNFTIGFLLDLP
ncbi:MAG: hypothetical protein H7Y04_05695 [Verrucomicrobia bacterium]|nr:hypothetical protein [Cytophagales bacterium]